MAKIQYRDVTKYFGQTKVIEHLNLSIRDAEFIVLVGPSGCGKSTTLRLLAGLEEITSGEIMMNGKIINDMPPKDRDISMVFQNYALYPHMTVYNNMAFGLKLKKYNKEEIDKRVQTTSNILGISDYLNRKPKELSGGQRQRVALGRAIVRQPSAFLFDEPLSNLDAKLRTQMRTEIKKLHTRLETTMIYVTHDQTEAMTMGERIVVIKDGHIHQIGTPLEVYDNPKDLFVAGFIGSPSMNFIELDIEENKLSNPKNDFNLEIPQFHLNRIKQEKIKTVIMGVRPEDIYFEKMNSFIGPISVKTEVIEPLGDETLLYVKLYEHTIVCKKYGFFDNSPGTSVSIYFDPNRIKYFNPNTGKSIEI